VGEHTIVKRIEFRWLVNPTVGPDLCVCPFSLNDTEDGRTRRSAPTITGGNSITFQVPATINALDCRAAAASNDPHKKQPWNSVHQLTSSTPPPMVYSLL